MPNFVWRAIALLRPAWRSDYIVQGYVRWLRADNVQLRAELASVKAGPYSHSGRMASANLIRALALGSGLLFAILWWKHSSGSEAIREGFQEGFGVTRQR